MTADGGGKYGAEGEGRVFYAYDRVVAYTNPGWIQTVFDTLTGLFDRVGLKTTFKKTVVVVCHPFWEAGVRADESYTRRMMGKGSSYKKRQQEWVNFP